MACPSAGGQRPAGRASPRDGAEIAVAFRGQVLELQRVVGHASGFDQIAPRDRQRRPRPFLIAGQYDGEIGFGQRSRRLHGPHRRDDHHHTALVVADAGAGRPRALADKGLKRALHLEHRVQMPDQQDVAPPTCMRGDQMAGPPGLAHVDPADLEPQRLQLGPDHVADDLHPGRVQRPAVLVHQPLQQADMPVVLGFHRLHHHALGVAGLRHGGRGEGNGQKGCKDQAHANSPKRHLDRQPSTLVSKDGTHQRLS